MRILWLSNCTLTDAPTAATGSWLQAMSQALVRSGNVELYNITFGNSREFVRHDSGNIQQWLIPKVHLRNGMPQQSVTDDLCRLIDHINPHIVHIWGVESFWGLLSSRQYITRPVLLEIQGLMYTCADVYMGGLSLGETMACIAPIDWIMPRHNILRAKAKFYNWGKYEKEILRTQRYISTQSQWVKAAIAPYCNPHAHIFDTLMAVRTPFMTSEPWCNSFSNKPIELLSVASSALPYKGVHIAIKALAILKQFYPNIVLKIVGDYRQNKKSFKRGGYVRFLEQLIRRYHLTDNVRFLGSLPTEQLVAAMQQSHVMLHTSHIESYSLALAEAMAVGVPSVIAYAGAMPELAQNGVSGLFYSPCDYRQCAQQVRCIIENPHLAQRLSQAARVTAQQRNNIDDVVKRQIDIYNTVIANNYK